MAEKPVIRVELEKELKKLSDFSNWSEWKIKAEEIITSVKENSLKDILEHAQRVNYPQNGPLLEELVNKNKQY